MQGKGRAGLTKTIYSTTRTYVSIGLIVLFLDQLSKGLVYSLLTENESLSVIGDFFRITFIYNPKGAFGFGFNAGPFYIVLSVVAVAIIIFYFRRSHETERFFRLNLSLVLSGAIGNIIDRILYGKVIDFLDVEFFDLSIRPFSLFGGHFHGYHIDRWPIFNIADCAITLGTFGVIGYIAIQSRAQHNQTDAPELSEDISHE